MVLTKGKMLNVLWAIALALCFSVVSAAPALADAPTVSNISPSSGPTAGGTFVTITGDGFVNGNTVVTIGDKAVTGVSVGIGNTSVTGITPPGTAGAKDVVVTTPGGSATLAGGFTYVATVIDIAAIPGVSPPVTGGVPVTAITATVQYTGSVVWSPVDNRFKQAQVYTATITLTPAAGYTLTGVGANFFTVAGATSVSNAANLGVVTAVFPSTSAAVIDMAAISGVSPPVTGGVPVTAITATVQYTGSVVWSPNDNPFKGAQVYTATITLTPVTGYTLTGVGANFFTVAGATSVSNAANLGVVTAVFPSTSAAVIDMAAISGVSPPVTGGVPVTAITATVQYTGSVVWSPVDNRFKQAQVYTATITLTPAAGYTLTGVGANFFTVAGATSVSNAANLGVVTAVFPSTSAAVIDMAAISGVSPPVTGGVPVTAITATVQYTGSVAWSPNDNPFKGAQVYTATITLTPVTGYTLTGVGANFFTVAGATSVSNAANLGVVTAVFPSTSAAVIDMAAISGVSPPVTGGTAVTAIAANAQYTGSVAWSPNDNPFKGAQVYTATITLTPVTGYTLTGVGANFFTVAGATSVSNAANSGVVTAVFSSTRALTVAGISPSSGSMAGGTPVTITGTGFVSVATVTIGGNAATGVSVVNNTLITGITPPGLAGVQDVVVTNQAGQSGTMPGGFTYFAYSGSSGGGGGGGGVSPPLPQGAIRVSQFVTKSGMFNQAVTITSADEAVGVTVKEGIQGLDSGQPLSYIIITPMAKPPSAPLANNVKGVAYNFGPEGATFSQPVTITFHYDPADLPAGSNENRLTIAVWDKETNSWVELPSVVDSATHTITAQVSHFSLFVTLIPTSPAVFIVSGLSISPSNVDINKEVTFSAIVANTGDLSGTYKVSLKINNVQVDSKDATLAGKAFQTVTFSSSRNTAGIYIVDVGGQAGSFSVNAAPAPTPISSQPPALTSKPPRTSDSSPTALKAPMLQIPQIQGNWAIVTGIVILLLAILAIFSPMYNKRRAISGNDQATLKGKPEDGESKKMAK